MKKDVSIGERRVLVLWADRSSPNLGVQVLGQGATAIARSVWGQDAHVALQDFAGSATGVPMGIKAIIKEFILGRRQIREFIASHDFALDTGAGDSFTDIYGYKRMLTIFIIQRWCLRAGLPLIMLPQTIGPFDTPIGKFLAKKQLKRISYVMSRDPKSSDISRRLGRIPDLTSSDLVFALPETLAAKKYDVLLNISGLLWNDNRHVDSIRYREAVFSLITGLTERGRQVTLLAHVVNGAANDDDLTAIREVAAASQLPVEQAIPSSLEEVRTMIGGAQLIIGARMHACLNALSLGIPTIPWAYSRKFEPLLSHLGWDHFVDLRADINTSEATMKIIESVPAAELQLLAEQVAVTGRSALSRTADGIRGFAA